MKKMFFSICLAIGIVSMIGCSNGAETDTHKHDDGSTHADHDTAKTIQQEFTVGDSTHTDSTGKAHSHEDGSEHKH
jgi:hypothetical protein